MDDPPITYQHVIGEQQIEIYMLKRELAALQAQQHTHPLQSVSENGTPREGAPAGS